MRKAEGVALFALSFLSFVGLQMMDAQELSRPSFVSIESPHSSHRLLTLLSGKKSIWCTALTS